jgi:hypothetical protein
LSRHGQLQKQASKAESLRNFYEGNGLNGCGVAPIVEVNIRAKSSQEDVTGAGRAIRF